MQQFRVVHEEHVPDAITVIVRRIDGRPSGLIEFPLAAGTTWTNGWLSIPTALECAEMERKRHRLSSVVINIKDRNLWPTELGELIED